MAEYVDVSSGSCVDIVDCTLSIDDMQLLLCSLSGWLCAFQATRADTVCLHVKKQLHTFNQSALQTLTDLRSDGWEGPTHLDVYRPPKQH